MSLFPDLSGPLLTGFGRGEDALALTGKELAHLAQFS